MDLLQKTAPKIKTISIKIFKMERVFIQISLACIFFLVPTIIFAQVELISLDKKTIKLNQHGYYVKEIIDGRHNICNIGHSRSGKDFALRTLDIEGDFTTALKKVFPVRDELKDTIPVIIKVNELHFFEKWIEGIEYKILITNLSFYIEKNQTIFHEFTAANFVTVTSEKSLNQIDNSILEALSLTYTEFLFRVRNRLGYEKEVTFAEVNQKPLISDLQADTIINPIYDGVYYTYNNFRDNLIDTRVQISCIDDFYKWGEEGFKKFKVRNDSIKVKDYWGVNYAGTLYIRAFNLFAPTSISGKNVIIKKMVRVNENISWDRNFFVGDEGIIDVLPNSSNGLIVNLVEASIKLDKIFDFFPAEFIVDPISGLALPMEYHGFNDSDKRLFICLPKHTYFDLNLSVNNKINCELSPFTYYIYNISQDEENVEICIESLEEHKCLDISTNFCNDKYIEVVIGKKGKVTLNSNPDKKTVSKIQKNIEMEQMLPIR